MAGLGRFTVGLLALIAVSGCRLIPHVPPPGLPPVVTATPAPSASPAPSPAPAPPPTALLLGVKAGPAITSLPLAAGRASAGLRSFVESCPRLTARADTSGLTKPADWIDACTAAATWPADDAPAFFARFFESVQVGAGKTFVTGYFEPEIAGVRLRQPGFGVPVYAVPPDLTRGWPESVPPDQRTGTPPLGRMDANGQFVAYYDRAAVDAGALADKGLEIGWAADEIEFFFLQIQGSGRLIAPDGAVLRIGYAGQNGREYNGIGALMRQKGLIGPGTAYPTSMQGIMAYLRANPAEGKAIMEANPSYVFFREITGDGPYGALNVPVRGQSSVATDPQYVPLGAPVWLTVDRPEANGLWIAQDTGGAIKGANRFDTFWGAGPTARLIAGGMSARGDALLFLPKGTLTRLGVQ